MYLRNQESIKKYKPGMIIGYCLYGLSALAVLLAVIYIQSNIKSALDKQSDYTIIKYYFIFAFPLLFSVWRLIVISNIKIEKINSGRDD